MASFSSGGLDQPAQRDLAAQKDGVDRKKRPSLGSSTAAPKKEARNVRWKATTEGRHEGGGAAY